MHGIEQLLGGAARAAMVADLQDVGMLMELGGDGALDGFFGVAFEQHGGCAVAHKEDEGVVVAGLREGKPVSGWGKDIDLHASPEERVRSSLAQHGDAEAAGVAEEG